MTRTKSLPNTPTMYWAVRVWNNSQQLFFSGGVAMINREPEMFTRLCGVYIIVQSTLDRKFVTACSSQTQNRKFRVDWMQSTLKSKKLKLKKKHYYNVKILGTRRIVIHLTPNTSEAKARTGVQGHLK